MGPTPFIAANDALEDLVPLMQAALGEELLGLYLYGSLASTGFRPETSDIDLLAVLRTAVGVPEFAALRQLHADFSRSHPSWDDRIEVQYVAAGALRDFKRRPFRLAAISPGEPFCFLEARAHWLVNWYEVRRNAIVLFGPSPAAFVPSISRREFVACVRGHVEAWPEFVEALPERKGPQAYAVLTLCRALYSIRTGDQVSKDDAAAWAQSTLPDWRGLIESARGWRTDPAAALRPLDRDSLTAVANFVGYMVALASQDEPG